MMGKNEKYKKLKMENKKYNEKYKKLKKIKNYKHKKCKLKLK